MKKLYLPFLLLFSPTFIFSQRVLPLLDVQDTYPFHSWDDDVYCMTVWDNKLVIGGDFTEFNQNAYGKILIWDGSHASSLNAMIPGINNSATSRITALSVFNGDLIIGANIDGADKIFSYDSDVFTVLNEDIGHQIRCITAIGNRIYVATNSSDQLYYYENSAWGNIPIPGFASAKDIMAYNDELYVCTDGQPSQQVLRFDEDDGWINILSDNVEGVPLSFSYSSAGFYLTGDFTQDGLSSGILRFNDGVMAWFDNDLPRSVLSVQEFNGHFYGICENDDFLATTASLFMDHNVLRPVRIASPSSISLFKTPMVVYGNELYFLANELYSFGLTNGQSHDMIGVFKIDDREERIWLDGDNLRVFLNPSGVFFHDSDSRMAGFEIPKSSTLNTIYGSTPWICAKSENDIYAAVGRFEDNEDGWIAGPVADIMDVNYANRYFRVWHLTRDEIEYHVAHYNDEDYVVPLDILEWPAHGDMNRGEAHMLAAFIDQDGDHLYEPEDGDIPDVSGDECAFLILNDAQSIHPDTDIEPMNIELHVSLSTFKNDVPDVIRNTVFGEIKLINRGDLDYDSLSIGLWNDFDLGTSVDDYIGCFPEQSLSYCYNGDNLDEASSASSGYGGSPPAQACMFLNHTLTAHTSYNNTNSQPVGEPNTKSDYFNYMNGRNQYGISFPDPFMLDGNPCTNVGDTEINFGNIPGDRRAVMSAYLGSVMSHDFACFDFAYFTSLDTMASNLDNACSLESMSADVLNFYESHLNSACDIIMNNMEVPSEVNELKIFPNPGHDQVEVVFAIEKNEMGLFECYDARGNMIFSNQLRLDANGRFFENLEFLANGLYTLKLTFGSHIQMVRWLKQ